MIPTLKETAMAALGLPFVLIFLLISIPLSAPIVSCILLALGVVR